MSDTPRGMPIYRDPIDRNLRDFVSPNHDDWLPADSATNELWRCLESLRKVGHVLEGSSAGMGEGKQRRIMIQIAAPMLDFFAGINTLAIKIERDAHASRNLDSDARARLIELRKRYRKTVLERSRPLRKLRNKLGAHTDKDLDPHAAEHIVSGVKIHEVGAWLHGALSFLIELTNLNCYAWTSRGYRPDEFRLMACEPFVLSLKEGPDGPDFVGLEMTDSPKRHVHDTIADVVESSSWMFAEGQKRLVVRQLPGSPTV